MSKVYGIDLGTCYSCIAVVDEGRPRVLMNSEGAMTTPSVIYFETADNIVVGQNAKDVSEVYPNRVIAGVKRAMGEADWTFEVDEKQYSAQALSALILKKLVQDAEAICNEKIEDVVITVPAYFGVNERAATKQAGEIAGLNVLQVVPEPTAAAIAYGLDQEKDQRVLVYDLGGGTFDVTIIDINDKAIDVICSGGNHQLGGLDWDRAVSRHLAECFADETGLDSASLLSDPETYQELLLAGEAAKEKLSTMLKVDTKVQHGGQRVIVTLTREKLHELTEALLEQTIEKTEELFEVAKKKNVETIDKILLVGGSTYMPQVKERLEAWRKKHNLMNAEIERQDPNLIVAYGAALMGLRAAIQKVDPSERGEVGKTHGIPLEEIDDIADRVIGGVTSRSFGVVVIDENDHEKLCNLIVVDDALPRTYTHNFGVARDDQGGATIRCMESRERFGPETLIDFEEEWKIGTAQLDFERPLPKGSPIEITFSLGDDGLLTVEGKDLTTHSDVTANFQTDCVMNPEEVAKARAQHAAIRVS